MTQENEGRGVGLGFLDGFARLFRARAEETAAAPPGEAPGQGEPALEAVDAEFESVLEALHAAIEAQRASRRGLAAGTGFARVVDQRPDPKRTMEEMHRAMRADVLAKHAELGTGIGDRDLEALASFLGEVETFSEAGRQSYKIFPRARYATLKRLWSEAGPLAVARLIALLQERHATWPDPIRSGSHGSVEQIEAARRRRLADVRESFLAMDYARTALRMVGIVTGWRDDYPDRGSPLWEETVLEAVACALRARLVLHAVDVLRRDVDVLLARVREAIGPEVVALQRLVAGGVNSLEQASQAVAGAMRVLDEVVSDMAWEHVQAELPELREQPPA
jgi:hypothetical protein